MQNSGVLPKVAIPVNTLEDLVTQELIKRLETQPQSIGEEESSFGLRLRTDGSWERHPRKSLKEEQRIEIREPLAGSPFDEAGGYGDKPVRTLTDFALYDEGGRLVPVEALELRGAGKIIALGTLVPPRKLAIKPVPPPAEKTTDSFASAAIIQAPPLEIHEPESSSMVLKDEGIIELRHTLEELLITPVTADALKSTGLGKLVNLLRRHPDAGVSRRAFDLKYAWMDLLERGGSEPQTVDINGLQTISSKVKELATRFDLEKMPIRFVVAKKATANLIDEVEDQDLGEEDAADGKRKRQRLASPVNEAITADLVAEYRWSGKQVEPSGPQESRLKQMIEYVRDLLQCQEEELAGWRMTVHRRKKGTAYGQIDSYFFSPEGRRYRSRNEVGKAVESGTFGVARSRAPRLPVPAKKSSAPAKQLIAAPPPESSVTPVLFEDFADGECSEARRAPYAFRLAPPRKPLDFMIERVKDPSMKEVDERADEEERARVGVGLPVTRVRLELIGWSMSVEYGSATIFVHTETGAYRLAGDQVVARPALWYYPIFCNAFLMLEACRLSVRTLTDYSTVLTPPRLELPEMMTDMLKRSRQCPGGGSQRMIVPSSTLRMYYYPESNRLTPDFIVSRQPLIQALVRGHFVKQLTLVDSVPFFSELMLEYTKRIVFQEKSLEFALAEEQKRRVLEKRKAQRIENKEKEKILALAKKLEDNGELLPDDHLLVSKDSLAEVAKATTGDAIMAQALEKMLSKIELPAVSRPVPTSLDFDPALLDGSRLLEMFESGQAMRSDTPVVESKSSVPTPERLRDAERALLCGPLQETQPVVRPDDFGETYARELHLWEGACLFARATGRNEEDLVGSFSQFRKQLYDSSTTSPLFASMLQAVAREDNLKQNPALPSTEDLCFHLTLDPAHDEAYDLTVWPLPDWLVDQNTWLAVLKSALCDWLRRNPEVAVLEALECGEVLEFDEKRPAEDASVALREQAAPKNLDYIALCDDGLRRLLLDPDADEFSRPVDRTFFPDYDSVIHRPMDIGTIRARIASGHYDPSKAPPGAYVWDSEKLGGGMNGRSVDPDGANKGEESDDDDDDDEKPSLDYLGLLADYRTGGSLQNADKRPDCGKCKHCLDKPRFGGYNILRQPCIPRQQAEQMQAATSSRDAKKGRTKELWKRRQAALAKEEAMAKFDEMYYAHGSLGGGHEGIAADVRLVFRNCRVYNKGTTPIYRAASKLDAMFGAYYLRFVASRDPKYAIPRLFGLPESILRDARFQQQDPDLPTEDNDQTTVVARIRRAFPSLIGTVRSFSEVTDLALLDPKAKLVAMGWLVDRVLETIPSEFFGSVIAAGRNNPAASATITAESTTPPVYSSRLFEPTGVTRDYLRVWATPLLIRETGGLVMLENLRTGRWSYFDELTQFEAFVGSLDRRGKREYALKKALDANLDDIKQAIREAGQESLNASRELKSAQADLQQAQSELSLLQQQVPDARAAADAGKEELLRAAEARHQLDEESRKQEIERKKRLWAEARTDDGKPYYYHVETRVTTWSRPKDLDLKFQPKPVPPVSDVTPHEMHLNTLLAKIEEVSESIVLCEGRVKRARLALGRDRAVLMLAKKLKLSPRAETETFRNQGFLNAISALVASILSLEHFCVGPEAEEFLGKERSWPQAQTRHLWLDQLRGVVASCRTKRNAEECVQLALPILKDSLYRLWDVFTVAEGNSVDSFDSFLRQSLLSESWRWKHSLDSSRSLADVSVLVCHFRRFVLAKLNNRQVQVWEQDLEKALLSDDSL